MVSLTRRQTIRIIKKDLELKSRYDWRSVGQCVSVSSPLRDLRSDIKYLWKFLSCLCRAHSLTRGRVCLLSSPFTAEAEVALRLTVSQYVLVSSPLWDLGPDIRYLWKFLSCLCGAPSLTRGRICLLSVTVSSICPLLSFLSFYTSHVLCMYNICKA
jgi:hypothetical protein